MNTYKIPLREILLFTILSFLSSELHGQILKKLGKRAQRAAVRTVENWVDREITKKTGAACDSILEPSSKKSLSYSPIGNPLSSAGNNNPENSGENSGKTQNR